MKKYVIKLNDKVYEVEMEEVTAESYAAATEAAKAAPKTSAPSTVPVSGGQKIEAPMPGSIVSVSVAVGDTIKKGQLLLVLEAMKMENEIVSPVDGKILSVGVAKGDAVNPGDLLVQIG
ncbi:biotin/lipoyl-binding protein [Clostridium sp. YIM B02515]|uniref:Biotin/lipoyl-binding protein n=1 Tax=Clostridium rhizosphaerae TaxID=2803861 RepID=A0ABS1TFS4_9CLOT|nr:biotin/lipoyl-containing protein [Clostridium rhizosphaerae]MBL4938208.1 biotin/lipoyl-binding protein [Clostridium rhizosphaerae]